MMGFQVGDSVRLKSQDEPWMAVNKVLEESSEIECVWIDKNNKKYVETFKQAVLTKDL